VLVVQAGAAPVLAKPVTAELGNITPYIIVPGNWSERDIEYHVTNVASGLAQNTGHNCIAAEVTGASGCRLTCSGPRLEVLMCCSGRRGRQSVVSLHTAAA
jgi:hypothetical protein